MRWKKIVSGILMFVMVLSSTVSAAPLSAAEMENSVREGINSQEKGEAEPETEDVNIVLGDSAFTLTSVGETKILTATITPKNAEDKAVVWSSDNEEAATVNPVTGEVTAIANGTAVITAAIEGDAAITAHAVVTVDIPDKRMTTADADNSDIVAYASREAENVALGKPVWASNIQQGSLDKVTDGIMDGGSSDYWESTALPSTNPVGEPQWLVIDLKAEQTLADSILVRSRAKGWSTDYEIQTSADGVLWTKIAGITRPAADTSTRTDTFSKQEGAENPISDPALKRYVRFYFKAGNSFAGGMGGRIGIQEIQVIGTQNNVIEDSSEVPVNEISFENTGADLEVLIGKTHSLNVVFAPDNATNKIVRFGILNSAGRLDPADRSIVTVSNDGLITAVAAGTKQIAAVLSADESKKVSVNVTAVTGYTITFHKNDGSASPETFTKKTNSEGKITETVSEPNRPNYQFDGWYTAAEGGTKIENLADHTFAQSATVYAHWKQLHTVTFDLNGGSAPTEGFAGTVSVANNTAVAKPSDPTKTNLEFACWYKGESEYNFDTVVTEDITLTAKWKAVVQFDANYPNAGTMPQKEVMENGKLSEADLAAPSRTGTGYQFDGWYKNKNFAQADKVTKDTAITENITLYAKWLCTVTFDTKQPNLSQPSVSVTEGAAIGSHLPELTKEGLTFAGWYKDEAFTEALKFGETSVVNENMTLYAKWTAKVTFHFNYEGAPASVESAPIVVGGSMPSQEDPTREGYQFDGWYTAVEGGTKVILSTAKVEKNTTLYAHWKQKFTVTFHAVLNGMESPESREIADAEALGELPVLTEQQGYTFKGWYSSDDYEENTKVTADSVVSANMDVYAKWTTTVTFNHNFGDTPTTTQVEAVVGKTITRPEDPVHTDSNMGFRGWYQTSGADVAEGEAQFAFSTPITAPITLYAKWLDKNDSWTVIFMDGDKKVSEVSVGKGSTVSPPAVTKDFYELKGWYENSADTLVNFEQPITENKTFYAKWEEVKYTVKFDTGAGGSAVPDTQTNVGKVTQPPNPTRTGYKFDGWYRDQAYTQAFHFDVDTVNKDNTTLYAKWVPEKRTVTFDLNDKETGSTTRQVEVDYNTLVTEPDDISLEGYTLEGWYKEKSCTTRFNFAEERITTAITLYAKWTKNEQPVIPVERVVLNETNLVLTISQTKKLTATVEPDNATDQTVVWTTNKPEIAAVSTDGVVTAVAKGNAVITATAGEKSASADVQVIEQGTSVHTVSFLHPDGIDVNTPEQTVVDGEILSEGSLPQPKAEGIEFFGWYTDQDCETEYKETAINKNTTLYAKWMVHAAFFESEEAVGGESALDIQNIVYNTAATETAALKNPKKEGFVFAGWYIKAGNEEKKFSFDMNLTKHTDIYAKWVKDGYDPYDPYDPSGITLDRNEFNLPVGASVQLLVTSADKNVTWTTSAADIATVENGLVTAKKAGTVTITAVSGEKKGTAVITVTEPANTSLNKTVDESGHLESDNRVGGKVVDGDTSTNSRWVGSAISDGNPATLTIDLEKAETIFSTIKIYYDAKAYAQNYTIETSNSKTGPWKKIAEIEKSVSDDRDTIDVLSAPDTLNITGGTSITTTKKTVSSNLLKRFVKFSFTKKNENASVALSVSIREIEIMGAQNEAGGIPNIPAEGVTLDSGDFSLNVGGTKQLTATVTPDNSTDDVTFRSSNESVATVSTSGLVTAVAAGTAVITVAAGGETASVTVTVSGESTTVTGITVNPATATLNSVGATKQLTANVTPAGINATVSWTSSNESVATVDNTGKVTAKGNGTATITATAGGKSATATITVNIDDGSTDVAVTAISLQPESLKLTRQGETKELTVSFTPENATNKEVTWSCDDTSVATVNNGVVTAVGNGTATITATAAGGTDVKAEAVVTVDISGGSEEVPVTGIKVTPKRITLYKAGDTKRLTAEVKPDDAEGYTIKWTSDKNSVATVDDEGTVKAVGNGTAKITAAVEGTDVKTTAVVTVDLGGSDTGSFVSSITLNKEEFELTSEGQTEKLEAAVLPEDASNTDVIWKSSDESVAVVDEDGVVTAVGNGTATITAEAADGSGITATATVTVKIAAAATNVRVTFNANGGTGAPAYKDVIKGTAVAKPANPKRTGYTFKGWFTKSVGGTAYNFAAPVTANITLYAQWLKDCTVKFNANGGAPAPKAQTIAYGGFVKTPAAMTRSGYKFVGWYTDPTFKSAFNFKTKVTANLTLYAKWDAAAAAGASQTYEGVEYSIEDPVKKTAVIKKADSKKAKKVKIKKTVVIKGVTCTVVGIGKNAFKNCKKMTTLTIGPNVTKIEKGAFQNCKKLKNITIQGKALKTIKSGAFKGTPKGIRVKAKGFSKKQKKTLLRKLKKAGMKSPKLK